MRGSIIQLIYKKMATKIEEKQDELIVKLQNMVDAGQDYDREYHEIWVALQALKMEQETK